MLALVLTVALSAAPKPAAASKVTQLVIEVQPASVVIFVDNKKVGTGAKTRTVTVKPGSHRVKLVAKLATNEETVSVKQGEKKTCKYDLRDSGEKAKDAASATASPVDEPTPPKSGTGGAPEPEAPKTDSPGDPDMQ